jgi:hypothetical protein
MPFGFPRSDVSGVSRISNAAEVLVAAILATFWRELP